MLTFFEILCPNILPNFNFWQNNRFDNTPIHRVRQNPQAMPLTNAVGEVLALNTTTSRRFFRIRGFINEGKLNFASDDLTDGSLGVEIDASTDAHEGAVDITSFNKLTNGYVSYDDDDDGFFGFLGFFRNEWMGFPTETNFRSGIRIHLADGHIASTSALAEVSFTGAYRPYILDFNRWDRTTVHQRLHQHRFQSSVAGTSRELRLWQNNGRPFRVLLVSTALGLGQKAGELLGSLIGASVFMPVAGAAIGGYISGSITTRLLSSVCPPDQVVSNFNPKDIGIELRYFEMEGRALYPPTMAFGYGGGITYGRRYIRDTRLPSFVQAEQAHPYNPPLPFPVFYNPALDGSRPDIQMIEADFRAIPFYEIFDPDVLNQQQEEGAVAANAESELAAEEDLEIQPQEGKEEELIEARRTPNIVFPRPNNNVN